MAVSTWLPPREHFAQHVTHTFTRMFCTACNAHMRWYSCPLTHALVQLSPHTCAGTAVPSNTGDQLPARGVGQDTVPGALPKPRDTMCVHAHTSGRHAGVCSTPASDLVTCCAAACADGVLDVLHACACPCRRFRSPAVSGLGPAAVGR